MNRGKKSNSTMGYVPEAELHGRILDLVNKRIDPKKKELFYEKGCCKSCVVR